MKILKQYFDIPVNSAGEVHKEEFEVDHHVSKIIGIQLTSDREDLMYLRGTQSIQINEYEVFPEGYESKLLMTSHHVAPNERFYKLGEGIEPGNGKVEVRYKDSDHPQIKFNDYRIRVYLYCEVNG